MLFSHTVNRKILLALSIVYYCLLNLGCNKCYSQEAVVNEHNLRNSWEVFNLRTKSYDRLRRGEVVTSIRWRINLQKELDGWIEIKAPPESMLLINNKYYAEINKSLTIELDSLRSDFYENVFDFVVYRNVGLSSSNLSTILYERTTPEMAGLPSNRSHREDFNNFFILSILLILMYMGLLFRKFHRDVYEYFSFQRSLAFKNREEALITTRPFTRANILFILLDALIIAFTIVTLITLTEGYVHFPFVSRNASLPELLLVWIITALIIFMSLVLKYIWIHIFNGLFSLGDFKYIQHFNALRFSLGSFLLTFILLVVIYLATQTAGLNIYYMLVRFLAILLTLRILVLFFKLRDYSSYKNFHLFSYLCGTEIIPFIILYKLVLE